MTWTCSLGKYRYCAEHESILIDIYEVNCTDRYSWNEMNEWITEGINEWINKWMNNCKYKNRCNLINEWVNELMESQAIRVA